MIVADRPTLAATARHFVTFATADMIARRFAKIFERGFAVKLDHNGLPHLSRSTTGLRQPTELATGRKARPTI